MICYYFFIFISIVNSLQQDFINCNVTGSCEKCSFKEMNYPYCSQTGNRQPILCDNGVIDFKSCFSSNNQNALSFYLFESIILAILFISIYIVIQRKRKIFQKEQEKLEKQLTPKKSSQKDEMISLSDI